MEALSSLRDKTVERVRALDRELGEAEVRKLMRPLAARFDSNREAHGHLESVFQDVMAHIDALQATAKATGKDENRNEVPFHRYEVNLLVDNTGLAGAPVVSLALPSLSQPRRQGRACAAARHHHHGFHVHPPGLVAQSQWRLPADRCDGSPAAGCVVGDLEARIARGVDQDRRTSRRFSIAATL